MVDLIRNENIRITFGMIVLNGEPFTRYNLRSLYPYAHQIIAVEGACLAAKNVATKDGHSRDTTLETLKRFKAEEDPDNKLIIVTAEDEGHKDGFWPGEKDEMSQAYAKRATGNYLWQVDSDEFYTEKNMKHILDLLDKGVDAVSFPMITFWGGLDYTVDGYYLRCLGAREYHRLFRWGTGYKYQKHRPPTVLDEHGEDTRSKYWLRANDLEQMEVYLNHYSLLFPSQVKDKCDYYSKVDWTKCSDILDWAQNSYLNLTQPFRVHNVAKHISWLERYHGEHPNQVNAMMEDISSGHINCVLRDNADIERLLNKWSYRAAVFVLYRLALIRNTTPGHFAYRVWLAVYGRLVRLPQRIKLCVSNKH